MPLLGQRKRRTGAQGRLRRAAAAVELAICTPVITLLVLASLEGANMLFLRQATIQAAYEAGKTAAKAGGSQTQGTQLANEVLDSRRITPTSIVYNPADVDTLAQGTAFSVTVSVPGDQRSITSIGPFQNLNITATATMVKE